VYISFYEDWVLFFFRFSFALSTAGRQLKFMALVGWVGFVVSLQALVAIYYMFLFQALRPPHTERHTRQSREHARVLHSEAKLNH
jgi:hypothetical protein